MNTHELADKLKAEPPSQVGVFVGFNDDGGAILAPVSLQCSDDGKHTAILPELPEQGPPHEDVVKAAREQSGGEKEPPPKVNEETVEKCFSEFELEKLRKLYGDWQLMPENKRPPLAACIKEELLGPDKMKEIDEKMEKENNSDKFWAYVLEAYLINVLEK